MKRPAPRNDSTLPAPEKFSRRPHLARERELTASELRHTERDLEHDLDVPAGLLRGALDRDENNE